MRTPDLDRERSEKKLTLADFLKSYNSNLPEGFPSASTAFLNEFKKTYPSLFKEEGVWSLDQHRKKVMDWLPAHTKSFAKPLAQ